MRFAECPIRPVYIRHVFNAKIMAIWASVNAAPVPMVPYSLADAKDLRVGPTTSAFTWRGADVRLGLGGRVNVANADALRQKRDAYIARLNGIYAAKCIPFLQFSLASPGAITLSAAASDPDDCLDLVPVPHPPEP